MHKKQIILGLVLMIIVGVCIGCKKDTRQTLYVYNWTYYIPPAVVQQFEKQFNVKVVYDVYSSNEEMFAKLKAGGKGYDLVFPSGDFVKIMIKEGLLEPIDKTKVPNFKEIDPTVLKRIQYDLGNTYSVPYMMAAAGIAVNTQQVKQFDKSTSIFDRTDLQGKMTLLDDMREVMGLALKTLGYSVNTTDPAQIEAAKQKVLSWKKNILKFDAESFAKGFAAGEFWVVQGYAENIYRELDEKQKGNVVFFIPKEGSPMYIDSMVILKGSKHKDLAMSFINFIHEPSVFSQIVDYLGLPSINLGASKLRKTKAVYELKDLDKSELKEDLGASLEKYNQAWEQIRI